MAARGVTDYKMDGSLALSKAVTILKNKRSVSGIYSLMLHA